jgi:phage-related minor tail protein
MKTDETKTLIWLLRNRSSIAQQSAREEVDLWLQAATALETIEAENARFRAMECAYDLVTETVQAEVERLREGLRQVRNLSSSIVGFCDSVAPPKTTEKEPHD